MERVLVAFDEEGVLRALAGGEEDVVCLFGLFAGSGF